MNNWYRSSFPSIDLFTFDQFPFAFFALFPTYNHTYFFCCLLFSLVMLLLTSILIRSKLARLKMLLKENFLSLGDMLISLFGMGNGSLGASTILLEKYSSSLYSILLSISVNSPYSLLCSSNKRWISIFL